MPATILVLEDDETIALGLVHALEMDGHTVHHFTTGEAALASAGEIFPDLAILDIMLPGIDGLTVLSSLKVERPDLPVLMLTAKDTERDLVAGLDSGADDYVTKPFSIRELQARVRARLRASPPGKTPEILTIGAARANIHRRLLEVRGREIRLTTHEAGVLAFLGARPGQDITREELLEHVWGYSPNMQTRTVDNTILKLRKKIEINPKAPRHILTAHGVGYRFIP
jgi:two-component system alkaline phosphatase synthesis response regulator PhoP